jgi:peptidoglycan/LPS O-acetylase OafA/YrhL
MPRVLGTLATLGVSYALYRAAQGYAEDEHRQVRELLLLYAWLCLAGAAAFFLAVTFRRRVLRKVGMQNVSATADEHYGDADPRGLGRGTLLVLAATLLAAAGLLLLFLFALQPVAPAIGTAAILILAATGWIAAGSFLDVFGMRNRVPVFLGLFVLAVLFSPFNDNHAVRTLDDPQPHQRLDLRASLREWLRHQPPGAQRYPIYREYVERRTSRRTVQL